MGEIYFNEDGISTTYNITHIYKATNGGTTFSSNLVGTTFSFFDVGATVDDAIYFAWDASNYYVGRGFSSLKLSLDQAVQGTGLEIVWEFKIPYYDWYSIGDNMTLIDETNGLQTAGTDLKVRFGRLPFQYTIRDYLPNDQRFGFAVRARIIAGTVTNGGSCSTTPVTYDGYIRLKNFTETSYATLSKIKEYCNANYPEIDFTEVDDTDINVVGYGEAYQLSNASILTKTDEDSWLVTRNTYFAVGNGSYWYFTLFGGKHKDGLQINEKFGYYGSLFVVRWKTGGNSFGSSSDVEYYGTTIQIGYYRKYISGTLFSTSGSTYWALQNGKYINNTIVSLGQGYWTGSASIINTQIYHNLFVTYAYPDTMYLDNINVFYNGTAYLIRFYGGSASGKLKGLNWYIPSGALFYCQSLSTGTYNYNYLNPSPSFPTNNDGTVKFMYLSGSYYTRNWNVREYYTLDIKVVDSNGDGIEGVTVTITDKDGNITNTATTNADGTIDQQEILRQHVYYNDGLVFDVKNPYTIKLSKGGYFDQTHIITIEEEKDLQFTLLPTVLNTENIEISITEDTLSGTIIDENLTGTISEDTLNISISEDNLDTTIKEL